MAVLFDRIYLINLISLVEQTELPSYVDFARRLSDRVEGVIELREVKRMSSFHSQWLDTSLAISQRLRPLIEHGVIVTVNPFDEFHDCGLSDYLQDTLQHQVKDVCLNMDYYDSVMILAKAAPRPSLFRMYSATGEVFVSVLVQSAGIIAVSKSALPLSLGRSWSSFMQARYFVGAEWHDRVANREEKARLRRMFDATRIVRQTVNLEVLSFHALSCEDILWIGGQHRNALKNFQTEMLRFASLIKSLPSEQSYEQEVLDIVQGTIVPALKELRREMESASTEFLEKITDNTSHVTSLATFMTSVYLGLPVSKELLLSAGLVGAKTAVQTYLRQKRLKEKNGLSLLVSLVKRASKPR